MTVKRHPVTGVLLNDISILRPGKLTEEEKRTGKLLREEGHPRWLAAAMLGCFPLKLDGITRPAKPRKPKLGRNLSLSAARDDDRQATMALDTQEPDSITPDPHPDTR